MAVGELSDGCVEEDDDGGGVDLMDGAGGALEVFGFDVAVDADAGADGEVLEGLSDLVGFAAGSPVVDGVDEVGDGVVGEAAVADGGDQGVDVGQGLVHHRPVLPAAAGVRGWPPRRVAATARW